MIVPLPEPVPERFTVRWCGKERGLIPNLIRPGYAIFDGTRRITITFPSRTEAERHRDNIARLYARYGW